MEVEWLLVESRCLVKRFRCYLYGCLIVLLSQSYGCVAFKTTNIDFVIQGEAGVA